MSDRLFNLSHVNHARCGHSVVIGEARYAPGGVCGPRIQRDWQLVVMVSGIARAQIDGAWHNFGAGQVCLMRPGQRESVHYTPDKTSYHSWCAVAPEAVGSMLHEELLNAPRIATASTAFELLMKAGLSSHSYPDAPDRTFLDQLGQTLLVEFLRMGRGPAPERELSVTERALAAMEKHLEDSDCLAQAAAAAGVTVQHLSRCFRRDLQQTPARHLWQLRIERATGFLLHSGMTLAEISARTGFQTPQHFSRLFLAHHGVSPSAFRRQAWLGKSKAEGKSEVNSAPGKV
jgi:AraC-like DNA-binding protein